MRSLIYICDIVSMPQNSISANSSLFRVPLLEKTIILDDRFIRGHLQILSSLQIFQVKMLRNCEKCSANSFRFVVDSINQKFAVRLIAISSFWFFLRVYLDTTVLSAARGLSRNSQTPLSGVENGISDRKSRVKMLGKLTQNLIRSREFLMNNKFNYNFVDSHSTTRLVVSGDRRLSLKKKIYKEISLLIVDWLI